MLFVFTLPSIELRDFSSNHHGGLTHIIHKAVHSGSFRNRVRVLGKKHGACACKGQGQSPWKIRSEVVGRGPKFGVGVHATFTAFVTARGGTCRDA